MGRPKKPLSQRFEVRISRPVFNAFNKATEDFLRDKPEYGKRGEIIEGILRDWLIENGHEDLLRECLKKEQVS